jgi:cytochrome P450
LDGAVAQTVRVANNDDVIPLSQPVTLRDGREVDHITIKKGQELHIPILAINKSKDLWGEDAEDFRPERWLEGLPSQVTDNVKGGASVFSHM